VASAVRQAINSPIQRFASDLGLLGMVSFGEKCPWDIMRPIAFVHDAVYVEARRGYEEEAASAILYCMENVPLMDLFGLEPPLPLRAEVAIGDNLADMEERKDLIGVKPDWY
jgi:DNA polymerase I-like protein with 3'-5' exonuclease and polymerase domains